MSISSVSNNSQLSPKTWESTPLKLVDFMDKMFTDYKVDEARFNNALKTRGLDASKHWNVELDVLKMRAIKESCLGRPFSPVSSRSSSPASPVSTSSPRSSPTLADIQRHKSVGAGPQDGVVLAISTAIGNKVKSATTTVTRDLSEKAKAEDVLKGDEYTAQLNGQSERILDGHTALPVFVNKGVPLQSRPKVVARKVHTNISVSTIETGIRKIDQGALIKARGQKG